MARPRWRRRFLGWAVGAGASLLTVRLRAQNAVPGMRRIGVLAPSTRVTEEITLKPFFDEMRQLGWIEDRTITYDRAYADDRHENLPRLAAELLTRAPELIYAPPQVAAMAAHRATHTIPIVFATGRDPVAAGLVASLARPGGNVTGMLSNFDSIAPKRLEILLEMVPTVRRIGLLSDPTDPLSRFDREALVRASMDQGMTLVVADASNPDEYDVAVRRLLSERVDVIFATSSISMNLAARVIKPATLKRVPVFGGRLPMVREGALLSYGGSLAAALRRSAQLVDKLLKGAKPADIAVEQPDRLELVINERAARLLGIVVPRRVLLRADEVIQ